jgi:RNA polymerase sigma-70 factor (ECF subfamily)
MPTDSILVQFLKDGNQQVFESIYEKFYGQLFVFAREYVLSVDVAHEMVQDTFMKLWEKRMNLDDNTQLQSFLYRVTRNTCLNYLKHLAVQEKFRQFAKSRQMETHLNYSALQHSSAEKIIADELEEKINETIDLLPPRCKVIFLKSRFEEKKYREIAEELGISIKTVENQIQKALKILRSNLSEFMSIAILLLSKLF